MYLKKKKATLLPISSNALHSCSAFLGNAAGPAMVAQEIRQQNM